MEMFNCMMTRAIESERILTPSHVHDMIYRDGDYNQRSNALVYWAVPNLAESAVKVRHKPRSTPAAQQECPHFQLLAWARVLESASTRRPRKSNLPPHRLVRVSRTPL